MADVLNRITKQFRRSVHTPDFPVAEWIINPDMAATVGFDSKYWSISGDVVSVVNLAARDTIDAAQEVTRLDSIADELDRSQTILKAFAQVVLDEFNTLRSQHGLVPRTLAQLKSSVRGKL